MAKKARCLLTTLNEITLHTCREIECSTNGALLLPTTVFFYRKQEEEKEEEEEEEEGTTIVQVNGGALQLFPPLGSLLLGSDRNAVFHAVAFLFRNKRKEKKHVKLSKEETAGCNVLLKLREYKTSFI